MRSVVYLPGVWDLVHSGHLNVIRRAKNCGDYLIVGVCSDRLVCETKVPPVNSALERMAMLSAIKGIDEVHLYDELDQSQALDMFRATVFAVGADFGALPQHRSALAHCESKGIEVVVIPRYPGISTTSIKERVLRSYDRSSPRQQSPPTADIEPSAGLFASVDGELNIGVDYHDTLSFAPAFFKAFFSGWHGKRYIVTGTPASAREGTIAEIEGHGLKLGEDYDGLLLGFEYTKEGMDTSHFMRMREHKYKLLKSCNISVFFDDNPFYVDFMRDKGIQTFQTILPTEYIANFGRVDPFFTCHLQERQFQALHAMHNSNCVSVLKENNTRQAAENADCTHAQAGDGQSDKVM